MVSIAEDNGLINRIREWVLHRACVQRTSWLAAHPGHPVSVAVNVSARQLLGPHLAATVARILAETGMDPAALTLEITEGVLLQDGQRAAIVLTELKKLGITLALDDFGTGYSSLTYLRNFAVDIIKIDRTFIAAMMNDPTTDAIIASIITLGRNLGLAVIAEGVETDDQHDRLLEHGCQHAQGYFYARPMPANEFDSIIAG
jgi:EAL domain-containing protein (putative c-di-GMP-specific phosphodiesterase class I)